MVEYLVIGFFIGLAVIVKTLIDCSIKLDTLAANAKEIESKLSDITFNVQQRPGDSFTIEQAYNSSFKVEPEFSATFKVELDNLMPVEVTPAVGSVFEVTPSVRSVFDVRQPSYERFKVKIEE